MLLQLTTVLLRLCGLCEDSSRWTSSVVQGRRSTTSTSTSTPVSILL